MTKIFFEQHVGALDPDTNNVRFYGLYFRSMREAAKFLTNLYPGEYDPWYARGVQGVIDERTGRVFAKGIWWADEDMAIKAVGQEDE